MHKHRKNTALILLAAVILILFTGCGGSAAAETDGSVSAGWAELPDEESLPEEFRYTFRPHVLSGGYAEIYGESFREEYFAFCDAVLSGSSSFPCSSGERFFRFLSVSNYCFPLAGAVVDRDRSTVAQGVCTLAYNMTFEKTRIKELADLYPDLADHLMDICYNIRDLMVPFQKKQYYNRAMQGSYSIKYVLPALFPDDPSLNYHNLEGVHNGTEASVAFAEMENMSEEELLACRENLLKYCGLDTFAMVKVWEKLREAAGV